MRFYASKLSSKHPKHLKLFAFVQVSKGQLSKTILSSIAQSYRSSWSIGNLGRSQPRSQILFFPWQRGSDASLFFPWERAWHAVI